MESMYREHNIEEEKDSDVFSITKVYVQDVCILKPQAKHCSLHGNCYIRIFHSEMCSEPFLCSGVSPCILTCETNSKDSKKGKKARKFWKSISVEKFPIKDNKSDASTYAESYDNFIETHLHEIESIASDVQQFSAATDNHQRLSEFHKFKSESQRTNCLSKLRANLTLKNPSNAQKLDFNNPFLCWLKDFNDPSSLKFLLELAEWKMFKLQAQVCSQRNHNFTECNGKCSLHDVNSIAIGSSNAFGRVITLKKTSVSSMCHTVSYGYLAETLNSECKCEENDKTVNNEKKSSVYDENLKPTTYKKKCDKNIELTANAKKFEKSENPTQSTDKNEFDNCEHIEPPIKEKKLDCCENTKPITNEKKFVKSENSQQPANKNEFDSCEKIESPRNEKKFDFCENIKPPTNEKEFDKSENSKQPANENEFDSCVHIEPPINEKKFDCWENTKPITNEKKFDKSENSQHPANENEFDSCEKIESPRNENKFDCCENIKPPTNEMKFDKSENSKQPANENEFDSCVHIEPPINEKKFDCWKNTKSITNEKKFDKSETTKQPTNENKFDSCENTKPPFNEKKFDCCGNFKSPIDKNIHHSSENKKSPAKKKKSDKKSKPKNVKKNENNPTKLPRDLLKILRLYLNPSNNDFNKVKACVGKGSIFVEDSRAKGDYEINEVEEILRFTGMNDGVNHTLASVKMADKSQRLNDSYRKLKVCACCKKEETRRKMFKKCSRCREERFPEQHYYCSQECLTNDWFESHAKEHFKFKKVSS